MKFAVVHTCDIHLRRKSDLVFKRLDKLANIISFSRDAQEQILLLVCGDIANRGSKEEYQLAEEFFGPLMISLGASKQRAAFIPGNHDCNFENVGDVRPRLLSDISKELETLDPGGETAQILLQVQRNFFEFCEQFHGISVPHDQRLFYQKRFESGGKTLEIRSFNSAWLSRMHEEPGSLGFPGPTIDIAGAKTDADVVISLVHHPSNWLNPASHLAFRKAVQETSDFLLTGHEHTLGGQVIAPFGSSKLVHFEGGPLQPTDSGESEFGILHIDLESRTWRREEFSWSEGAYTRVSDSGEQKLFDKSSRSSNLQITKVFMDILIDTGSGFLHPRHPQLTLPDIYVYPDLKLRAASSRLRKPDDPPLYIRSKDAAERLLNTKRLVVAGPNDSGKTALSKMLYLDANSRFGKASLLLRGCDLNGKDPASAFRSAMDTAIIQQYGKNSLGKYGGLSPSQRVLIVDDWEKIPFNRAGRAEIMAQAKPQFDSIVLLSDDIPLIEEASPRTGPAPLANFEIADIREFGFRLRGVMIRKWHDLGDTYTESEEGRARRVSDSVQVVDTVLGRNLLPAYPVNILTLLQTYDADSGAQNGGLGSYGQVYEALITARLAKVSIKSIDIGTKITFLARFAWRLFDNSQKGLAASEWRHLCDEYYDEYKIRIDADRVKDSCIAAGVLVEDQSGVRFIYGFVYCYFVAKFFQENLADTDNPETRNDLYAKLKDLSLRVYNENNASIVIFYVFLTKDRSLISHVINSARLIFSDFPEFDFDSHVQFINRFAGRPIVLELPEGRPDENREKYDERRDEAGEQIEPNTDPSAGDLIYSPEMPFEQRLVIGIRYLTLMGQILRNFPGSLKANTKLELARESYSLGLRVLGAVFALSERDAEVLTRDVARVLRERLAFAGTDRELTKRAESIVTEMLRNVTYGILKRISHAVGLRELEETYSDVAAVRDHDLGDQFVQLSIRLDHFEPFPKRKISEIAEAVNANFFAYMNLQDLVMNHLYLFPRSHADRQWAGSKLGIRANLPQIRGSERKRLKS